MFTTRRPLPSSVPEDVFEPPVLELPKLTRNVPVPGVLLELRTVKVTANFSPMFTRAGPLYVTTLPSDNVIEFATGGGAVGTGVGAAVRVVGTGVPPGACVGAGVSSIGVAVGCPVTATGPDGFAVTPGALADGLALGPLWVPATT